jgi:hypothetical protein
VRLLLLQNIGCARNVIPIRYCYMRLRFWLLSFFMTKSFIESFGSWQCMCFLMQSQRILFGMNVSLLFLIVVAPELFCLCFDVIDMERSTGFF